MEGSMSAENIFVARFQTQSQQEEMLKKQEAQRGRSFNIAREMQKIKESRTQSQSDPINTTFESF